MKVSREKEGESTHLFLYKKYGIHGRNYTKFIQNMMGIKKSQNIRQRKGSEKCSGEIKRQREREEKKLKEE